MKNKGRSASLFGLAAVILLLAGCATPPPADDPDAVAEYQQLNDPLEPTNRAIFDFNDWVDEHALRPAALTYREVTPPFARDRIANILANLKSPAYFANDMLQGNVSRAGVTVTRFLLNSTFGVGGIMDVATPLGMPAHQSDFGQTLGTWGVGEGFYLVLPVFGPSNPRDGLGLAADSFLDPLDYYLQDHHMRWVTDTRFVIGGLSTREQYIEAIDDIKRTSLDYYSAMRSLNRQRRDALIQDGKTGAIGSENGHSEN